MTRHIIQLCRPLVAAAVTASIAIFSYSDQLSAQQVNRDARQEARAQLRQDIDARPAASAISPGNIESATAATAHRAADLGLWLNTRPGANGLVVADMATQGALANAGLLEGDQIVAINGRPVTTETQLVQLLLSPQLASQSLAMAVLRGGQQQTLTIPPGAVLQGITAADPLFQSGLLLDDTDPNRVVVQRVFPRTPAFYAGLRAGDVIGTINGQQITHPALLAQALTAGGNANVQVTRNGQTRDLAFTLGDATPRTAMLPGVSSAAVGTTGASPATAVAPGAIGPVRTTANPPVPPGIPTSPAAVARPTSPSLQVQPFVPGGAPTAAPGAPTAVPGAPTAAPPAALPSGTLPPTGGLPAAGSTSPRNTAVPAFGSPSATGATGTLGGAGSTAGGAGATGGTGAALGGTGSTAGPSGGAAAAGGGGAGASGT